MLELAIRRGVVLGLLLVVGCAGLPPAPAGDEGPPGTALQPVARECLERLWQRGAGVYRFRQSAVFAIRGQKIPLAGLLQVDAAAGTARLVAMNDLGVKLFDVTATRERVEEHYRMAQLDRYPGLAEAVGESLRRIYLGAPPQATDAVEVDDDAVRFVRHPQGERLEFVFDRGARLLREIRAAGRGAGWTVRYPRYRWRDGTWLPVVAELRDARAGYLLTLWTEEVRTVD